MLARSPPRDDPPSDEVMLVVSTQAAYGCTAGYFRQRKRDSNTWRGFKMFQVWFAYCCLNGVTRFHRLYTTYTCAIKCWTFRVLYIPYVYIYIHSIYVYLWYVSCSTLDINHIFHVFFCSYPNFRHVTDIYIYIYIFTLRKRLPKISWTQRQMHRLRLRHASH